MLIRRDLVEARLRETGYMFNPALFMYFEETDLCEWARARGHRVMISANAVAYHERGQSLGGPGNPYMHYYMTRNRILLARTLLRGRRRLSFHARYAPSRVIEAAAQLLKNKPGIAFAIVHGVWDGYRSVTGRWVKHPPRRPPAPHGTRGC